MDHKVSINKESRPLRRSARQTTAKALSFEPTPRGPLKRTKKSSGHPAPAAAVNGSREKENGTEDESPNKKSRVERVGEAGGDENEMDVQESAEDMDTNQDLERDSQEDTHGTHPLKQYQGAIGDVHLYPHVALGERCRSHAVNEDADFMKTNIVYPSSKGPTTKSASQMRLPVKRHHVPVPEISMAEYKSRMESIAKRAVDHDITSRMYHPSESSSTVHQRLNNIPIQKEPAQCKKKELIKKTDVIKTRPGYSSGGFMWSFWCLAILVLLSSAALLAYKKIPVRHLVTDPGGRLNRAVRPEVFAEQLSLLEAQFPSQRPELWKRSKIHLERHLRTAQPTEPVSLILTAGRGAESTLRCLAQGLAASFSLALNASVLQIDGASKADHGSDQAKLDIDSQLEEAFRGDKPVAVIHRLEELPAGSTLIFYRYCDHESAAYKRAFLLFTVLLPQDEVSREKGLKDVEEMVQDYVKERLVGSGSQASFNEMDTEKYGGLWSRVSHLVLPVVSENEVEQKGCR